MQGLEVSEDMRPVTDLEARSGEIVGHVAETAVQHAVREGEADLAAGRSHAHADVMSRLSRGAGRG